MAILNETDILTYAPTVTLTGAALTGAILQAQFIAEGAMGANRPLEIRRYSLIIKLNPAQQTCYLPYFPIVVDDDHPFELQARFSGAVAMSGGWLRSDKLWETLSPDSYIIESENNRVALLTFAGNLDRWDGSYRDYCNYRFTEVKVNFYSGFDFASEELSNEAIHIKSSLGQVLTYLQSGQYQGVKRLQVPFREFEIEHTDTPTATIPESLLAPFKRYRAVVF